MAERDIFLLGQIILKMGTRLLTGMHIGAGQAALAIGGVENPVVRHPITQEPYIPGSSFKGKVRSLLEKFYNKPQNYRIHRIHIHCCKTEQDYKKCEVCRLFGVPAELEVNLPTRLLVRDAFLSRESQEELSRGHTDLLFTEVKYEAAIDRVTAAATPRPMERVPAGAIFDGPSLVLNFYRSQDYQDDTQLLDYLIIGLNLLEEDYLGSSGSRGYGRIRLENLKLFVHGQEFYKTGTGEVKQEFKDLQELTAKKDEVKKIIEDVLKLKRS